MFAFDFSFDTGDEKYTVFFGKFWEIFIPEKFFMTGDGEDFEAFFRGGFDKFVAAIRETIGGVFVAMAVKSGFEEGSRRHWH